MASRVRRVVRFPSLVVQLMQSSKKLPSDVLAFKVPKDTGKLQLKEYFEAVYGVNVASVNTAVMPGKSGTSRDGTVYKRPDWKRAFVRFASLKADSPTA